MTGKAIDSISNSIRRALPGQGVALALVLLFFVASGSMASAKTSSNNTARVNAQASKSSTEMKANNKNAKKSSVDQALALGTVSMQQTSQGFRLFGDSGLTLHHSSVMSQKVYASPNPQFDKSYSYSFGMGLKLTDVYFSNLSFSLAHQPNALDEREQLKLRNTSLDFSRSPLALGKGYFVSPSVGIRLPLGREVVRRESLRIGLAPSATLTLPPLWSGSKLGTSYSVSGTYNNHRYTHHSSGNPNIRWGVNHGLRFAYPIVKGLTVSAGANHGLAWTTLGTTREYVGHSESLSWQASPNASLSVGHTNQGEMFALDGVVYDFSFLSERNSIVFGRLSLSI